MSKEQAVEYVSRCLTRQAESYEIPELSVPKSITDSLIVRRYMLERKIVNTISLGDIWTKMYYPYKAEFPDDDPGYREHIIKKMTGTVKHLVYSSVSQYYMLRPASIALKRNKEGKYHLISCVIEYSGSGEPKEILAESLSELEVRLELELLKLMEGRSELYSYKLKKSEGIFKSIIAKADENERKELWGLIELLVLGSSDEQNYARERLQSLCNPYIRKKARQLSLISALEKTEQSAEESVDIFRGYFTQAIDTERKFTENSLAERIGCSASTISRIRSGEIRKPRKNRILQIGVALGLNAEQLRQFVRSSGNSFPITKADIIILDCLENGMTDYDRILFTASKYDAVLYEQ